MHHRKFFGELLVQLKAGAYKVVQVKAKEAVKTLPEYDEAIMKEFGNNVSAPSHRQRCPYSSRMTRRIGVPGANGFIDPYLPTRASAPVADGWAHEIKHDGIGPRYTLAASAWGPTHDRRGLDGKVSSP